MKKYIKFIIGIIVLVIVVIGLFFGKKLINNESNNKDLDVQIQDYNTIHICFDESNCPFYYKNVYKKLVANNETKVMSDVINKINLDTIEYYNKSIDSKFEDGNKCEKFDGTFLYRYGNSMELYKYEDDDYFMLSVKRNEIDYCSGVRNDYQVETYCYDKVNDKLVETEDIIRHFNLDEHKLLNIVNSYYIRNDINRIDFLDDYAIFINEDKDMYISVFHKNNNNYVPIFIENVVNEK